MSPVLFMRTHKTFERATIEWGRTSDNIGVILPWPIGIFYDYLKGKNILDIISMFWNPKLKRVNMLDLCILMIFWWQDEDIISARTSWYKHPHHHCSDLVFDKQSQRLIIEFKQPDIDGKHWDTDHLHITIGSKNG